METPAYIPSPEAIHLAAADAASATGAPGARPPRRLSKHKRSPSACDASDVKSTHPLLQKSTFQRWQEEINRQLSRGPLLARQGPPASPAIAAPQATCPVTPDDAATFPLMMNPHQCATAPESSPAVDGEPAAATGTSGDNLPPLPAPTQQEQMDLTSSRKRPRADSSDEEEGPRKVGHSAPSEHDSRDSESSQDSSALQPSEDSEDSCDSTHTSGSSSIESPSPEETTSSSASTAEELTTDSCTEPHSEVTHNTLEAAPPAAAPSPAAVPAAEEVHENQDEGDTMEETAQEQDEDISPPHPSEAFLRSPPRPTTSVNPRRKKRKQKKKGKPKAAQGPSGTTNFPSTSDGIHSRPATTANAGRLPSAPPLALTVATPPASQREDDEGFITPQSKAARRRQKHLSSATLKVDPAVVGTVLFRPSAPGGSFFGIPRLTLAEALSARPGITAIRVNHRRNIVAVDATTRECLESLLALTELRGIPVSGKEPADRRSSTGFLHGVDGEHDDNTLLASLQSSVPVLSAAREGRTVTLRFGGPVPPEQVMLFRVRFPVRPARPRPLQCKQCGRYGHVREACRWPDSCIRCGRAHTADEGCQRPRCVNCGGPHSADTPHCPRWQEQRQVATIMASSTAALSRRMVAAAAPRDREYRVVDWQVYRRLFRQDTGGRDLLQLVADSARAATVIAKVQQGRPVPDIRHLALRAARRRAERQALSKALPELWTEFRRVDAVCRRHARRRRNQGWLGVCISIDRSRDGTKAWRLLRCLLTVPRAFNQVLSLAIHLCIGAAALTEQLADQFAARDVAQLPAAPPPAALPCPASCHHPGWASMQCAQYAVDRRVLVRAYRDHGLPATSADEFLFPRAHSTAVGRAMSALIVFFTSCALFERL
ncbi:hypothetical protein HPB52_003473 [Rhipicephalus sanguineus]|uniref:CCHC-type domain-containing protein n=1 Tax=Rhipicephalus sanguineus TaxID=34632 RepID=A0A9D4T561_RHISA|nr:hypothetical protein HPB52_003473 [Rhipicephalus sanguineus]